MGATRGGSNLALYKPSLEAAPRSIVADYHTAAGIIIDDLNDMIAAGQQKGRLILWHKQLPEGQPSDAEGFYLNSRGGQFHPQIVTNIQNILQQCRDSRFNEVHVSFGPGAHNLPIPCDYKNRMTIPPRFPSKSDWCTPGDPLEDFWLGSIENGEGDADPFHQWTSRNVEFFEENWNLIFNTWPMIRAFHDPTFVIKMDFGGEILPPELIYNDGEGVPGGNTGFAPGYAGNARYHRTWGKAAHYVYSMWINFNIQFGKTDVIGFALNGEDRVKSACQLYDQTAYGRPYVWSVYAYANAGQTLTQTDARLKECGDPDTGLIISEAYFNDLPTALDLNAAQASPDFSRPIHFLTQWYIDSTNAEKIPTIDYFNYSDNGW